MATSKNNNLKEIQDKLLTLKARQVQEELSKLNADELAQMQINVRSQVSKLEEGDYSFANEKEISNQRYLLEVLNNRQIEIAKKEYFKAEAVYKDPGLKGQDLANAKDAFVDESARVQALTRRQTADRLESGYIGQLSPMSKVLSEINSREVEITNGESVSDSDIKTILKDEMSQLETLKLSPVVDAQDIKSRTELAEKLNHISSQRELLSDANNHAAKSRFEAHPDDAKIDRLKEKIASFGSSAAAKATPECRAAETELTDARRDYKGNDPAVKLHRDLVNDRELDAKSRQLSEKNFYSNSMTGADGFRNDIEISRIAAQRTSNSAAINSIAIPSSAQQQKIQSLVDEIRQGQREDQTLEAVSDGDLAIIQKSEIEHLDNLKKALEPDFKSINSQEFLVKKIEDISHQRADQIEKNNSQVPATTKFEPHPDDEKIRLLKSNFENVEGGIHNSKEYTKAQHELHHARVSYAGNDPAQKLHGAFLKEKGYEYQQRSMEAKLFSDRTSGASEVRNLQTGLADLKTKRNENLSVIDRLVSEKDGRELAQRQGLEAKLAEKTKQSETKAPILPASVSSASLATAKADPNLTARVETVSAPVATSVPKQSLNERLNASRELTRLKNEQSNVTAGKASAHPSSASVDRAQQLSAAVDANAQKRAQAAVVQAEVQKPIVDNPL